MIKFWLKQLFILILPFGYIGRELKKSGKSNFQTITITIIGFLLFCCFWNGIFNTNNENLKSKLYQSNDQVFELSRELEKLQGENNQLKIELKPFQKQIDEAEKIKEDKYNYKKWIESQLSSWDGSNKQLKDITKQHLNNPDSFKHIKTVYYENKSLDYIIIEMTFTAENGFGGTVTKVSMCKLLRNNKVEDFIIE